MRVTMKKPAIFLSVFLLLSLFVLAGCHLLPISDNYKKGTLTTTTFESEYLNLRFSIPDNYVMATTEDLDALLDTSAETGVKKGIIDYAKLTTVNEMMASAPSGAPSVVVMVEKLPLRQRTNMTENQYFDALKTQLDASENRTYTFDSESTSIEIAGQNYKKFAGKAFVSGTEVFQDYMIRKNGQRMIVIIATYTSTTKDAMNTLLERFTSY